MVESRVGLGDAARAVWRLGIVAGVRGVIAPLAELIQTDHGHAAASSGAGRGSAGLIVESVTQMPGRDELAALPGRVTLIPLTGLRPCAAIFPMADPVLLASGRLTALRSVVTARAGADEAVSRLLDRVLGSSYLVEDLDAALMLSATMPGARFCYTVRRGDGDGWTRACGSGRGGWGCFGVLQRRSELAELEVEVARLSEALEKERAGLNAADAEAAAISAQQTELRAKVAAEHRGLVQDQTRSEQLAGELSRVERDSRNADEESQQHRTRLSKLKRIGPSAGSAEKLHGLHGEQVSAAKEIEEQLHVINVRADADTSRSRPCGLSRASSASNWRHRGGSTGGLSWRRKVPSARKGIWCPWSPKQVAARGASGGDFRGRAQIERAGADAMRLEDEVAEVEASVTEAAGRVQSSGSY